MTGLGPCSSSACDRPATRIVRVHAIPDPADDVLVAANAVRINRTGLAMCNECGDRWEIR